MSELKGPSSVSKAHFDAMADPIFTELVQRIRKHFFAQSTLD